MRRPEAEEECGRLRRGIVEDGNVCDGSFAMYML
jgi:hypothetical protein